MPDIAFELANHPAAIAALGLDPDSVVGRQLFLLGACEA